MFDKQGCHLGLAVGKMHWMKKCQWLNFSTERSIWHNRHFLGFAVVIMGTRYIRPVSCLESESLFRRILNFLLVFVVCLFVFLEDLNLFSTIIHSMHLRTDGGCCKFLPYLVAGFYRLHNTGRSSWHDL